MRYFVMWTKDIELDPWFCGTDSFDFYGEAKGFADRQRNKGLTCQIYYGTIIDEAHRAKQDEAMAELTRLGQELQPEYYSADKREIEVV